MGNATVKLMLLDVSQELDQRAKAVRARSPSGDGKFTRALIRYYISAYESQLIASMPKDA